MNLTDKLDKLMSDRSINRSVLSRESGIPYTTIDGFYRKGTDNVKLTTLKLSKYFSCSLDFLVDDNLDVDENPPVNIDNKETKLLEGFNKLNESGKDKVIEKFFKFLQKK